MLSSVRSFVIYANRTNFSAEKKYDDAFRGA